MRTFDKHKRRAPWYGPSGLIPEILLFLAFMSSQATYTTRDAEVEAAVAGIGCAALAAVLLVLSWERSTFHERLWSLILAIACVVATQLAGDNLCR